MVYYGPVELSPSDFRFVNLSDDLLGLLEGDDADPYPKRAGLDLPVEDPTDLYNSVAAVPRLADEAWLAEILGERRLLRFSAYDAHSIFALESPVVSREALERAESFSGSYFSSLTDMSGPSRLYLREVPSFCRSGNWVKYGACVELECRYEGPSVTASPPTTPSLCGYKYCDDVGLDPDVQARLAKSPGLSALAGNPFYSLFSDCALTDLMVPCVTLGLRVVRPAGGGLPLSAEPFVRPVPSPDEVPVGARYAAAYSDVEPIRAVALSRSFSLAGDSAVAGTDGRSGSHCTWVREVRTRYDVSDGSVMDGYPRVEEYTIPLSFTPSPSSVGLAGLRPVSGRTAWNVDSYSSSGPAPFRCSSESTSRYDTVPLGVALFASLVTETHRTGTGRESFRFVPEGDGRLVCRWTPPGLDGDRLAAFLDVVDGVWLGVQVMVTSVSGRGTATFMTNGSDSASSGSATAVAGSYVRFVEGAVSRDGTVEFRVPVAGGDLPVSPPSPDFSVSWSGSGSGSGSGTAAYVTEESATTRSSHVVGTGPLVIGIRPRAALSS